MGENEKNGHSKEKNDLGQRYASQFCPRWETSRRIAIILKT